ncbi:MAG TPA: hypothetical protein VF322_15705 [Gammaproteobacteria bacterium]
MDTLKLALEVHSRLSELVAPATPDSIRASSFFRNWALLAIVIVGVLSLGLVLFPALIGPPTASQNGISELLQIVGAAGFGAAFYSLHTATTYLRDGTFEPQYNQIYLIRFILGVFGGVILARFAADLLDLRSLNFAVTTLALIGGYSAEAVAQVLKRVSDTLVTLVRGSAADRAEAEAAKEKAQTATKIATTLQDALGAPDAATREQKIRQAIAELMK